MSRMRVQLVLASALIAAAIVVVNLRDEPVTFVMNQQMYQEDKCVPQDSGVLSLAVQRVNHIVAPECEEL